MAPACMAALAVTPYSIASSPLLFCSLACRITGVAGCLLFSQQRSLALCLLGRLARSLFFQRALGCSRRFRSDLSLLGKLGFALLPCRFTLRLAFGSRRHDGFALPHSLDFGRIKDLGLLEPFEHVFLGLGCEAQAVLQALIVVAHG